MKLMNKEIQKFLNDHLSTKNFELVSLEKGGSDRSFFRVSLQHETSFVFMHYGDEVTENAYWVDINRFMASLDINVPRIITQDTPMHFILMEDLGDVDLCAQASLPWEKRRDYYYQALTQIRRLHSFALTKLPPGLKTSKGYDRKLYLWEHNYFMSNFVEAVCQIKLPSVFQNKLSRELDTLTVRMLKTEPCLIHRDFQSQNILIKNNQPIFIDFQGMRRGNLFYDLGSLICDPYISFTAEERSELINFYYDLMKPDYSRNDFVIYFWEASAQRLMQALGAYGFLGLKKNKPDFLKHVYNGIKNLILATFNTENLPVLHELSQQCESILADRQI
jgi:N-acetylmuramate 1-kinase